MVPEQTYGTAFLSSTRTDFGTAILCSTRTDFETAILSSTRTYFGTAILSGTRTDFGTAILNCTRTYFETAFLSSTRTIFFIIWFLIKLCRRVLNGTMQEVKRIILLGCFNGPCEFTAFTLANQNRWYYGFPLVHIDFKVSPAHVVKSESENITTMEVKGEIGKSSIKNQIICAQEILSTKSV